MTHSFPQRRSSDLNLHLLTGKIATPGNSPFSLTGQPSACGTAREVGTFSHRLPADLVVMNPAHRATAEKIWKIPAGTIQEKPGLHAVAQNRARKRTAYGIFSFPRCPATIPSTPTSSSSQIGRESCRKRGCYSVRYTGVAVHL